MPHQFDYLVQDLIIYNYRSFERMLTETENFDKENYLRLRDQYILDHKLGGAA